MARRLGVILFLIMLPFGSTGCVWLHPGDKGGWTKALRPPSALTDENLVTLDIAILQRPLGDTFLNDELWKNVDEMLLDLDHTSLLKKNGIRMGQVVGITPGGLQTLLKSERYCLNPRQRVIASGHPVHQVLGPLLPQTGFTLYQEGQGASFTLDQARFILDIAPTIKKDKVQLEFMPRVETGELMLPFKPDIEQSQWTLRVDKPHRAFPELAWKVDLEPNRWLVIGAFIDEPDTLGYRAFTQEDGPRMQRLLVMRVHAPSRPKGDDELALENILHSPSSLPLALQATYTGK